MDLYTIIIFFVHDGRYCRTLDPSNKYSNAFLEMVKLIKDKMYIDSFMIVTYKTGFFFVLLVLNFNISERTNCVFDWQEFQISFRTNVMELLHGRNDWIYIFSISDRIIKKKNTLDRTHSVHEKSFFLVIVNGIWLPLKDTF